MRNVIVYFHGYGSSAVSDKVTALKAIPNTEVYAFNANIDPDIATKEVSDAIDYVLLDDLVSEMTLTFIGTSLGAWLASKLAAKYGAKAILINPSVTPYTTLQQYGVDPGVCAKYTPLVPRKQDRFIFAERDDVIDNTIFRSHLASMGYDVTIVPGADHRFAGELFQKHVVDTLTF